MARRPTDRAKSGEKQLFSLRLPKQLWAELSVVAKLRGKPLNELLGEVLQAWWREQSEHASVVRLVKASATTTTPRGPDGAD